MCQSIQCPHRLDCCDAQFQWKKEYSERNTSVMNEVLKACAMLCMILGNAPVGSLALIGCGKVRHSLSFYGIAPATRLRDRVMQRSLRGWAEHRAYNQYKEQTETL